MASRFARAVLVVADTIKPTSRDAVAGLRDLGLRPVLLTGDNAAAARAVADEVGIDEVIAEVLPRDKVNAVADLQREGRVVAMVGDGVNDAAALAQSDLGLAMGTGTDVAIEASDLTLVRGDLRAAVDAIRLARRTLGTIKANLFWAFAYNLAALPLAALGLLNPLIAGAAMALSSVFVVSNSLRLRRFRRVYPVIQQEGDGPTARSGWARPWRRNRRSADLAEGAAAQPSSDSTAATLPDPQLVQLAAIAARLESAVDALTHPQSGRLDHPEPVQHNGNGQSKDPDLRARDDRADGDAARTQEVDHLRELRAEIDAQLRKLQHP
jgi:P-type Cu+ transporter